MSLRSPVLAAALLLSACSALATSSASVQLTGVRLQLFDLDPSDGVSPSISFSGSGSRGDTNISYTVPGSSGNESAEFTGLAGPWSPGTAVASGPWSSASATLSGAGNPNGSTLSAVGTANGPIGGFCTPGNSPFNDCFFATASFSANLTAEYFQGRFELSPNTLVVLSMDASMAVAASSGGVIESLNGVPQWISDSASASAGVSFFGPGPSGGGQQSSGQFVSIITSAGYDSSTGLFNPQSDSYTGTMSVSFSNLSSAELTGNFNMAISLGGNAHGDARLVPEPGTWGLMLAGLLAVGAITRRTRRR